MKPITRRGFGKRLLAAGILPLTAGSLDGLLEQQKSETPIATPDTIAGYALSSDEKTLAAKYLAAHEKRMTPLRVVDLPNSLAPSILYRIEPPVTKRKSGNG